MSATPYPVLIVGLPRSMTYWTSQTLGYDHDATASPVASAKPGLCDTGFALLPPEAQAKYFDAETKFVHLRRPEAEVLRSLMRQFPEADPAAIARLLSETSARLEKFFAGRPHLELSAPLTPVGLSRLSRFLGREAEFGDWFDQLATRRDVLEENPSLKARLASLFPSTL